RVQISGKGSQILKLRSLAGDITRRVPDTLTTSNWAIHLDPTDVELALPKGADVRVMEVRPSEITLALDSVTRKEVRIVSLVSVTPDSGQVLHGGLSMTPTTVRLVGPERSLAAIDSVTTVPTEITNVSGEFTRNVPIDTAPLGNAAHIARHGHLLRREAHDPERRGVDRHVAGELARDVRDFHRHRRHGIDGGQAALGADQTHRRGGHREPAVQHLTGIRRHTDER